VNGVADSLRAVYDKDEGSKGPGTCGGSVGSFKVVTALVLLSACGCAADTTFDGGSDDSDFGGQVDTDAWSNDTDAGGGGGGLGVGQGGAQDFGQFKQILEDGLLPAANTLDDVGFFNEHKIMFPAPDCGADVCLHGRFGTLGNMINGSDCTIVLLGLNTPIDPSTMARPPLNLVLAVDTSGSMSGDAIRFLQEGLRAMLPELHSEDIVSIVDFDSRARIAANGFAGDDPRLIGVIDDLVADGTTNIYDALDLAYEVLDDHAEPGFQNRVILLSDGEATAGIIDPEAMLGLAEASGYAGYTTTTIGMGRAFDVELMRGLSEVGSGAFYFVEDVEAVTEVFAEELSYFLVPLAKDAEISVDVGDAWRLRNIYGTRTFTHDGDQAVIEIPSLQLAHRESAGDAEAGRRGGGGAIIAELLPAGGPTGGLVADLGLGFTDPADEARIEQTGAVTTELEYPISPEEGVFEDDQVEKAFVMLNIYVGFRSAAQGVEVGALGEALGTLVALRESVAAWVAANEDPDIADDLRYIDMFISNLEAFAATQTPPPEGDDWIWD
jgi:Ca-activated chloride channel family protein